MSVFVPLGMPRFEGGPDRGRGRAGAPATPRTC